MRIDVCETIDELLALREPWERLAGAAVRPSPFLSWLWCTTWWRHYGGRGSLFVLVGRSEGQVVGIAPLMIDRTPLRRIVRWLGAGEVWPEYLEFLTAPAWVGSFERSALLFLLTRRDGRWDTIDLADLDAQGPTAAACRELPQRDIWRWHERPRDPGWVVELPADWDEYIGRLSVNRRSEARRVLKRAAAAGVQTHAVESSDELEPAWQALTALHQKRRAAAGEPGCFGSGSFRAFHRELLDPLLRAGQLILLLARLRGQTIGASYCLRQAGTVYYYQGGFDPAFAELRPGTLLHLVAILRAIDCGDRAYDLMAGCEPYKQRWATTRRALTRFVAAPSNPAARLRTAVGLAWENVKRGLRRQLPRSVWTTVRGWRH